MPSILAFGELLWDLLPDLVVLGGAPFNFAYRVHSLGNEVAFASRVGDDELGVKALAQMRERGMHDRLVQRDPRRPTGTVNVSLDEHGSPHYEIVRDVAYDCIEPSDALLDTAGTCDCVCFGTLIQRSPVSRTTIRAVLARATSALRVYDVNLRTACFAADTVADSLEFADIVKLNDDEVREVQRLLGLPDGSVSAFCELAIARWRLQQVVVTLGGRGVYTATAQGESGTIAGHAVDVADTVGAGDAFTAGFVHSLLAGAPPLEACAFGNALGALVAATHGGTTPVALDAVRRLLLSGASRTGTH